MKQSFSHKQHETSKKYFKIKDTPGKWDTMYIEKTKKYIPYISWIPGLKMIGVGNSLSMNSGTKDSDIDLFIVTTPNRIWLVRILVTLVFQLLGVRKTASKHAGRFCLSFFATTNALNFGDFAIENDVYLYFWILYFKPLYDHGDTYNLFIEENSKWADFSEYTDIITGNKRFLVPDIESGGETKKMPPSLNPSLKGEGSKSGFFPFSLGGKGWDRGNKIINSLLKYIFLPRTKKSFQKLGKPFGVIITDDMLKFHDNDIRKQVSKDLRL